jgi:hypothetical protein
MKADKNEKTKIDYFRILYSEGLNKPNDYASIA